MSKRLSDREKSEIRLASINAENAIRIKQIPLEKMKVRLAQLNDELARRKSLEVIRLAAEHAEKARKERLAKEKAEEARQQELARQQAEQNKTAQEAAERFRQEQAKRARESAERDRKERAGWEARWKAAQEAAENARQEQVKQEAAESARQEQVRKQAADARKSRQHAPTATDRERTRRSTHRSKNPGNCGHRFWWNKVEGHHVCAHCTRPLFKFAEQCPGCDTIACVSCRYMLKAGSVPSAYKGSADKKKGNPKSRWKDRTDTSGDDSYWYDWD
jgi:hypothetical protein